MKSWIPIGPQSPPLEIGLVLPFEIHGRALVQQGRNSHRVAVRHSEGPNGPIWENAGARRSMPLAVITEGLDHSEITGETDLELPAFAVGHFYARQPWSHPAVSLDPPPPIVSVQSLR